MTTPDVARAVVFAREGLDRLVDALIADGYQVIGPTVRDSAIVLAELDSAAQLPAGWGWIPGPGITGCGSARTPRCSRIRRVPDPGSSFCIRRGGSCGPRAAAVSSDATAPGAPRYAFLGVRGCDLAAVGILGRVLGGGQHRDGSFVSTRQRLFIVAVNCTEPAGCLLLRVNGHRARGRAWLRSRAHRADRRVRALVRGRSRQRRRAPTSWRRCRTPARHDRRLSPRRPMSSRRTATWAGEMPAVDLPALIRESRESPQWEEVASRCLTCANCTMVCPTCFCTTTEDVSDLTGDHAERWQHWASCFEPDFSYVHGGSVRQSGASRYRQWFSHKLGTWHDQFGSSGCVGCGRCIAWCPVGIDITAEAARLTDLAAGRPGERE